MEDNAHVVARQEEQNQTPEQGQQTPQEPQSDDLLSRVSKFVVNEDPNKEPQNNGGGGASLDEDLKSTIEAIEDPVVKEKMLALRKSLVSGANNKYMEIATLRKEMESFMAKGKDDTSWTPERVQALANDPNFVAAAQQITGTSDSGESLLSEEEQMRINKMNNEIENLKKMNAEALKTQQQQIRAQQHAQFQAKYANYDPTEIDQITFDMIQEKINATPEHVYKAFKHDENVRRAYELGRQDERNGVKEKIESSSAEGIATSTSTGHIEPEKEESSESFLNRIIQKNLGSLKRKG